jgi:hypothetical protein
MSGAGLRFGNWDFSPNLTHYALRITHYALRITHYVTPMKPKRFHPLVEHVGSGFQLPQSLARKIDALSRTLPRDFTYRRIARKADSFTLDAGERTDVSLITTDALDRDGEVVLPSGGDWSDYNRVVTFAHRYDQLPVGSNWWIRARGNGLIAKTHYPDRPTDWGEGPWLPSAILHLMQQPVPTCTGKSIGFLPLSVRGPTVEELSRRPELKNAAVIDRWVGVEYAVVPVPCNPEAQMQAVAKGLELGVIDNAIADLIQSSERGIGARAIDQRASRQRSMGAPPMTTPTGAVPEEQLLQEIHGRGARATFSPADLHEQIVRRIREKFAELTGRV